MRRQRFSVPTCQLKQRTELCIGAPKNLIFSTCELAVNTTSSLRKPFPVTILTTLEERDHKPRGHTAWNPPSGNRMQLTGLPMDPELKGSATCNCV